jgi:hypothetical protein
MSKVNYQLQMRRVESPLPMVKNWSDCAGCQFETKEEANQETEWWVEYDIKFHCSGYEYRVVEKKIKSRR